MRRFSFLEDKNWWILWAILTPLLYSLLFLIDNKIIRAYIFMSIFSSFPSFFGLWIYNKEEFKKEYIKLVVIFLVLFLIIFSFGQMAALLAVIFLLFIFTRIGFSKEQFYWSFGSMMLYLFLIIVPFLLLFIVDSIFKIDYDFVKVNHIGTFLLLTGVVLQGIIFGKIMHFFYIRRVKGGSE